MNLHHMREYHQFRMMLIWNHGLFHRKLYKIWYSLLIQGHTNHQEVKTALWTIMYILSAALWSVWRKKSGLVPNPTTHIWPPKRNLPYLQSNLLTFRTRMTWGHQHLSFDVVWRLALISPLKNLILVQGPVHYRFFLAIKNRMQNNTNDWVPIVWLSK